MKTFLKSFLAIGLALGIAVSASAQDYATVVEAAPGGLLFAENFEKADPDAVHRGVGTGSTALGTSAVDHIWGWRSPSTGPSVPVDFSFTFTPGVTASNAGDGWTTGTQLGQSLADGSDVFASPFDISGLDAGTPVTFRAFVTTHGGAAVTTNIANPTTYTVTNDGADLVATYNMNAAGVGARAFNQWGLLGEVTLLIGETYSIQVTAPDAWVSHRTHGVLFEPIPEPSTYAAIFGGLALLGAFVWRRRRA